jgi:outer membrane protein, heavy metal efflux system
MFRTLLPLTFLIAAIAFAQDRPIPQASSGDSTVQRGAALSIRSANSGGGNQAAPDSSAQAPTIPRTGNSSSAVPLITLDEAIQFALANNPSLKASRTQIDQSQAQEITAKLRPNPTLSGDSQFLPIFHPSEFNSETLDTLTQFDIGVGYLFERGGKRKRRLQAAQDATAVTRSQVADAERALSFNVAQEFINALLAKSNLNFATMDLESFQQTVNISQERYKAGDISEGDLLRIKLQLLTFQTDVAQAKVAKVQALINLRQLVGYSSIPRDYDVAGDLEFEPLRAGPEDLQAKALSERPDLRAARQGQIAAKSQIALARANAKQDLSASVNFSHVSGSGTTSWFLSMPLPIFDRNQGEIKRTMFAAQQSSFTATSAEEGVMTDVRNAWEAATSNQEVVGLYTSGYLKQAQDSREITGYAYKGGAATLLDLLDAERSYRSVQLGYRQALANYMLSLEQLRQAVGSRKLP